MDSTKYGDLLTLEEAAAYLDMSITEVQELGLPWSQHPGDVPRVLSGALLFYRKQRSRESSGLREKLKAERKLHQSRKPYRRPFGRK